MRRHIPLLMLFFMVAINLWLLSEAPSGSSSKWKSARHLLGFGKKRKGSDGVTPPATPEALELAQLMSVPALPPFTQQMLNKELLTLQSNPGKNPLQKLMAFVKENHVIYVATKLPGLPEDLGGMELIKADTWEDVLQTHPDADPRQVLLIDNNLQNKNDAQAKGCPALWSRGFEWEKIDIDNLFA